MVLPDAPQRGEVYAVDTADLFAALEGDSSGNTRSLERVCRLLRIPTEFLHNAGNDAYVSAPLPPFLPVPSSSMRVAASALWSPC